MTSENQLQEEREMGFLDINPFIRSIKVFVPGSAGELVQGQMNNGEHFLVTNPIRCFSEIQVSIGAGHGIVRTYPNECVKVKDAMHLTLELFNITDVDVHVHINSQIPIGKGMASSTSDIVGSIEALVQILDKNITPEQISEIAISIEPSDGLMYRGIVAYNHRRGKLLEYLGTVPPTNQLIIDTGGIIDTMKFNNISKLYTADEIDILARAFNLVKEGIKTSNLTKVGQGATMSARVNQRFLQKDELESTIEVALRCGAFGVICAHSGTILSLLFSIDNTQGLKNAIMELKNSYQQYIVAQSIHSW